MLSPIRLLTQSMQVFIWALVSILAIFSSPSAAFPSLGKQDRAHKALSFLPLENHPIHVPKRPTDPRDAEAMRHFQELMAELFDRAAQSLQKVHTNLNRNQKALADAFSNFSSLKHPRTEIKQRRKILKKNFNDDQLKFLNYLTKWPSSLQETLERCKTQTCLDFTLSSLRKYLVFARALHDKNELSKAISFDPLLEDALNQAEELSDTAPVIRSFKQLIAGDLSAAKIIDGYFGTDEALERNSLKRFQFTDRWFKSASHWLHKYGHLKSQAILRNEEVNNYIAHTGYGQNFHLICNKIDTITLLIGEGWDEAFSMQCYDPTEQRGYLLYMGGFAVGLGITTSIIHIKVMSPKKIRLEGTWGGLTPGAGFGLQAMTGIYMGKKGSLALLGAVGATMGARISVAGYIEIMPLQ